MFFRGTEAPKPHLHQENYSICVIQIGVRTGPELAGALAGPTPTWENEPPPRAVTPRGGYRFLYSPFNPSRIPPQCLSHTPGIEVGL